jgi:8-oxo-dGTP pyrophosphatase MutT (NUDIX family)
MTRILFGDRIGRQGKIRLGCSAVLFDEKREKVLLTRRADNGQWCLPSGGVDPGESVTEACEREAWEETGLRVRVKRLTCIFSDPNRLVIYDDSDKFQIVTLNFEVEAIGEKIGLSNETTEVGFYSLPEIETMDLLNHHRQFISDVLAGQDAAFIR